MRGADSSKGSVHGAKVIIYLYRRLVHQRVELGEAERHVPVAVRSLWKWNYIFRAKLSSALSHCRAGR